MKHFVATAFCGLAAFAAGTALTSCGGSSSEKGSSAAVRAEGLAPLSLDKDMILTPVSGEQRGGKITLHADEAGTCEFAVQDAEGWTFYGTYTYTKWGADTARVRMEHLDLRGIISAGDLSFTIDGYLKFIDEHTVQFVGTETLGGHGGGEEGQAEVNDPFGFAWTLTGEDEDGEEVTVSRGGSKTFSYTYMVETVDPIKW